MAETGNQVSQITESLRKPETRTVFTEVLLSRAHAYFGEMFNQQNPPDVIQKFNCHKGVIFLTGSILRGTARLGSSDIDTFLLYDDPEKLLDKAEIGNIVTASEDYHPDHISFQTWLARKCKENPEWITFYEARRKYAEVSRSPTNDENIEKYFIQVDAEPVNISELSGDILSGEIFARDWELDSAENLVPQLLTATADYAIASSSGDLHHYQQETTATLAKLESKAPSQFLSFYGKLSVAFRDAVLYEGGNHGSDQAYYHKLMQDYVENSGRFGEKSGRAARILKSVKRQVQFPPFISLKKRFQPVQTMP